MEKYTSRGGYIHRGKHIRRAIFTERYSHGRRKGTYTRRADIYGGILIWGREGDIHTESKYT